MIFGQFQEPTFAVRESKLYVPKKESFQIPLRYIDVTRPTRRTLYVMLESFEDDYWNVERDRDLIDAWTGFTRGTTLDEKSPD